MSNTKTKATESAKVSAEICLGTNAQVKAYIRKLQDENAALHEQAIDLLAEARLGASYKFKAAALEESVEQGLKICRRLLATLKMTTAAMGDIDILCAGPSLPGDEAADKPAETGEQG